MTPTDELDAWAASGAMHLTGHADGPPLGPPAGLVTSLFALADRVAERTSTIGSEVRLDPLTLLTERAALAGLRRRGRTSPGGATRLVPTADGWLAVSLARPDDIDLVPAWLRTDHQSDDPWSLITSIAQTSRSSDLVSAAAELGLAVTALGECADTEPARGSLMGEPAPATTIAGVRVVDLGALWAGPLCGALLADAGADVIKVESISRPDGARAGNAAFFDLMNAGKRSVALDLRTGDGHALLRELVASADVVIEASRPRALEQMGVVATDMLEDRGTRTRVWASITAHGRTSPGADRIGFGDDAAAAGGLVVHDGDGPVFCADAVADPATGMTTAAAVLDALSGGGTWMLDVAMARVAASLAGPTISGVPTEPVAMPRAPRDRGHAAPLGTHTHAVLRDLATAP